MAKADARETDSKTKLLVRVRLRAKVMMDADRENRQLGIADMRFLRVPGAQWEDAIREERGPDRPMYEFNKLNVSAKSIINEMRANRPMGKVRAAEDGDTKTADVMEGLVRNIISNADFDTVTDYAAEYQVGAGLGAWRITLEYQDNSWNQVIDIDPLLNPFCLYADPSCKDLLKRDAEDWWYTDRISKTSFERRWPDAEPCNIDDFEFDDDDLSWEDDKEVRIGEYWYKEPYEKTILLLSDGSVINELDDEGQKVTPPQGVTVLKSRVQKCHKIMMCIVSGSAILEGPVEWAGPDHPWVLVYGDFIVINGKTYWNGITRPGKDAQRAYNVSRTAAIETVELAPTDKPWMTPLQVKGLEGLMAESHKKNFPFNLYNPDPLAPGAPVRMGGPNIPAALVQEMQIASDDIKAVTGVYDASLGAQGNETSGKAINARKQQGEIANFNYMDNMGKGVKRTWEILVNLIPKVIDTEQTVRILGADGKESYETVNKLDPVTNKVINDLSRGRFDTAITVGPSYATRRQEAAEAYTQLAATDEGLMISAPDLVYKAMDLPYAQEIAERRAAMLPPPIQQLLTKDKQLPPEVQAALTQVQQAQAQVEQHGQLVQAAQMELKELEASAKGDQASAKLAQAQLKTAQVEYDARAQEFELAQTKLDFERALLNKETENAILQIKLAQQTAERGLIDQAHQHDQQVMQTHHELQNAARDVETQVTDASHDLSNQQRDMQESAKDAQHGLEKQATQMSVSAMQAAHKQDMNAAKAQKAKPQPAG